MILPVHPCWHQPFVSARPRSVSCSRKFSYTALYPKTTLEENIFSKNNTYYLTETQKVLAMWTQDSMVFTFCAPFDAIRATHKN
jgi:hypothetical protein